MADLINITREHLINSRWVFGFLNGFTITDNFYFAADGSIQGYDGKYEKFWLLENGRLILSGADREPALRFEEQEHAGRKTLIAKHPEDPSGQLCVCLAEYGLKEKTLCRVAVITMVYNEQYYLPLWLRHYGAQVGPDHLYVIDHGSTDGSVDPALCNRIRIPRDKFDDQVRAAMVSALQASLLNYFDWVIYTDCDEFIVLNPRAGASLVDYLDATPWPVIRCVGVNIVPQELEMPQLDLTRPILSQRPFGFATHWYCKPLITSRAIKWTAGFHHSDSHAFLDFNVWLFHLKFADLGHGLSRLDVMRQIEWGPSQAGFVATSDQSLALLENLQNHISDYPFGAEDMQSMFNAGKGSPMFRIPDEFHQCF